MKQIIVAIIIVYLGYIIISSTNNYHHRFRDNHTIGRITETSFPAFTVREYKEGKKSFTRDYINILFIEFKEIPSDIFYKSLDSLINEPNSGWSVSNNQYSYSIVWGNGYPAPIGESDKDDIFLDIILTKGNKQAKIRYGAW